jgi:hypothetical protein
MSAWISGGTFEGCCCAKSGLTAGCFTFSRMPP